MFPDRPASSSSPVLGVPIALFKLILAIKQLYQKPLLCTLANLSCLRKDVGYWEAAMTLEQKQASDERSIYDDATLLYILIASLLIERLTECDPTSSPRMPQPEASTCWQFREMIEVLRRRRGDSCWERGYVASWPVYTVGIFAGSESDIKLVREDMARRWTLSNFAQVSRFSKDLEKTWERCHADVKQSETSCVASAKMGSVTTESDLLRTRASSA
jgi:hypothetical protein